MCVYSYICLGSSFARFSVLRRHRASPRETWPHDRVQRVLPSAQWAAGTSAARHRVLVADHEWQGNSTNNPRFWDDFPIHWSTLFLNVRIGDYFGTTNIHMSCWTLHGWAPRLVPFEAPKAKSGVANGSSKPNALVENRCLTHKSLREVKDLLDTGASWHFMAYSSPFGMMKMKM